ncbi:hypothetical protein VC83_09180 [Pseudogymnoascus destructans]|uniref:HTH CENPB-type domain-containing protein n=1 Tax=Pseudogymnoascus destructans TaxID=655981 RepID=A0A176ZZW0_9PEZI|nr:uncharacterized protein VC83_09180 [Pseudogymnoascus destructans]OAF54571.1 hypothetical protein VC83_09180 [Pseudogymnoascus destructans]
MITDTTMVRRRSPKAQEVDIRVAEAVLGVQSGKYNSSYAAAKALGLCKNTVANRVQGMPSRTEARQKQQLLPKNQEATLLKWIKVLTKGGYAPSHHILREVADEVHLNHCRVFEHHKHSDAFRRSQNSDAFRRSQTL